MRLNVPSVAFLVTLLALPLAILAGRWFARTLARLVPKTETSAINRRSLGGRRGVIAQGTAVRGRPAQARVRDGYGNTHYVRVEPVDATRPLDRLLGRRQHRVVVADVEGQVAAVRSFSCPDQRLQPANRQKTAGRPVLAPSPCRV